MIFKKKLKRIPSDLVSYIQIETEDIDTSNDKTMISAYCMKYMEMVDRYIELLDTGSREYIVPHNRPYLVRLREQLKECHKAIMAAEVYNP